MKRWSIYCITNYVSLSNELWTSLIQSFVLLRWSLPWCDWGIQYLRRSPLYRRGSYRHDSSSWCWRRLDWYEPITIVLVFLVRCSTTWGGTPNSSWGAVTEKGCNFHHGVMCYTVVLQNLRQTVFIRKGGWSNLLWSKSTNTNLQSQNNINHQHRIDTDKIWSFLKRTYRIILLIIFKA